MKNKDYSDICDSCRGKGYSTHFHGLQYAPDFIGDREHIDPAKIHIEYCRCDRGKQLQKYFKECA